MQKILAFLKKKDLYLGIVRYALGIWMMPYAIAKIFALQCVLSPTSIWQTPVEQLQGSSLAWAFLGHSLWFQVMLGFMEFVPSILLFFRKTTLLGAILMLPMTLGVLLINHALDLWSSTQQISLYLFLLNCLIFVFEWRKVKSLVTILMTGVGRYKWLLPEILLNIAVIAYFGYPILKQALAYRNDANVLSGDWYHHHAIEWTLTSEKVNDTPVPPRKVKAFFGPASRYGEVNDSAFNDKNYLGYELNEKAHLLRIEQFTPDTTGPSKQYYNLTGDYHYEIIADTLLSLRRKEKDSTSVHTWVFKKRAMNMQRVM